MLGNLEVFEVIGIQHKVGTYNDKPFDNMVFSVVVPADTSKGEVGQICSQLKVKTSLLNKQYAVGDLVSPIYDRFGRIVGLSDN